MALGGVIDNLRQSLADPRGAPGMLAPLSVKFFSLTCIFREKNGLDNRLAPLSLSGKSWIRRWPATPVPFPVCYSAMAYDACRPLCFPCTRGQHQVKTSRLTVRYKM